MGFEHSDLRSRKGYLKPDYDDARATLSGVASTETTIIEIDNRRFRAGYHVGSFHVVVTANPNGANIKLKAYGSFDGTNWTRLYISEMPEISSFTSVITVTNTTTDEYRDIAITGSTSSHFPLPYGYIKWVVVETAQDNAVGYVDAAVGGI